MMSTRTRWQLMAGMEASDDVATEWAYLSGSLKEGLGDLWPIGEAVHKDVNFAKVLLDIPGYIRHGEARSPAAAYLLLLLTCRHMAHICSLQGDTLATHR